MGQRLVLTLARWQPVLLRFLKFALVGTVGVLVNSVVLIALHAYLGLALVPASAIAVEIAILQNFFWNNRWTFRERGVYDVSKVSALIDDHERIVTSGAPAENHMMFLWQLVNVELWLRRVDAMQASAHD